MNRSGQDSVLVSIGDKIIRLWFDDMPDDVDTDDLTKIHYENLYGELVTVSALLNRIGLIQSAVEDHLAQARLEFSAWEAGLRKTIRANNAGKKLTLQEIDDEVLTDPIWLNKKRELLQLEKHKRDVDSLYWSIQSKDRKLSVLLKGVTPEEFAKGIVEGAINLFYVQKKEALIK